MASLWLWVLLASRKLPSDHSFINFRFEDYFFGNCSYYKSSLLSSQDPGFGAGDDSENN